MLPNGDLSLVLHARLDEIDRVHHEGAESTCKTAQGKVVTRLEDLAQHSRRLCLGLSEHNAAGSDQLAGASPRRVQDLGEVAQAQAARGLVQAGKVEEDVGLHGREQGEARDAGGVVEELGTSDLAVAAARARPADDELHQINLLDHVLEGAHVRVRHLAALCDVAQGAEVFKDVVGELVLGGLEDDALEVVGLDVAVAVLVELQEGLANALALETSQQLAKLRVVHSMALLLASDVQLGPLTVPVEGQALGALVELVEATEVLILDLTGTLDVEEAESDLVLGVGFVKEVLEGDPVGYRDSALALAVSNLEEQAILLALDSVLFVGSICQSIGVGKAVDNAVMFEGLWTHIVFVDRGNSIDELSRAHEQLS